MTPAGDEENGTPRCGHEPASGLYYEVLGARRAWPVPVVFIHGGGATGACFRATPDGRPGWADRLAQAGYECWVTDWPGGGRSGNRNPLDIAYADVVDGYLRLLREVVGEPVVVVCHSMGGAITWQLVAELPELVAGVVSVAGAYPANVAPTSEVESDDGRTIVVRFADTGVRFVVDRLAMYLYEDAYIYQQAIASSTRFPMQHVARMRAGLVGLPPTMLLQRLGVLAGLPTVDRTDGFRGKPIRLVAGTEDPAHTRAIETRTVELLRGWGADAALVWLGDLGIVGNGHFLFFETNSDAVLAVVEDQIRVVSRGS